MKIRIRKKIKIRTLALIWVVIIVLLIWALFSDAAITQPTIRKGDWQWSSYHAYRFLEGFDYVSTKSVKELVVISRSNEKWARKIIKKLKLKKYSKKQRVYKILNWIARTYSYDVTQKYVEQSRKTHRANCSAYADTFYVLRKAAKIPVRYIIGFDSGVCHAWNRVKVKGKWYWSDPTRYDGWYGSFALSRKLWRGYGDIFEEW